MNKGSTARMVEVGKMPQNIRLLGDAPREVTVSTVSAAPFAGDCLKDDASPSISNLETYSKATTAEGRSASLIMCVQRTVFHANVDEAEVQRQHDAGTKLAALMRNAAWTGS